MPHARNLSEKVSELLIDIIIYSFHFSVRLWPVSRNQQAADTQWPEKLINKSIEKLRSVVREKSFRQPKSTNPFRDERMSDKNSIVSM
jgi:hypothetical protein